MTTTTTEEITSSTTIETVNKILDSIAQACKSANKAGYEWRQAMAPAIVDAIRLAQAGDLRGLPIVHATVRANGADMERAFITWTAHHSALRYDSKKEAWSIRANKEWPDLTDAVPFWAWLAPKKDKNPKAPEVERMASWAEKHANDKDQTLASMASAIKAIKEGEIVLLGEQAKSLMERNLELAEQVAALSAQLAMRLDEDLIEELREAA
jgi:hypothetical protein